MKIIIGSEHTVQEGWVSTNESELNLLSTNSLQGIGMALIIIDDTKILKIES